MWPIALSVAGPARLPAGPAASHVLRIEWRFLSYGDEFDATSGGGSDDDSLLAFGGGEGGGRLLGRSDLWSVCLEEHEPWPQKWGLRPRRLPCHEPICETLTATPLFFSYLITCSLLSCSHILPSFLFQPSPRPSSGPALFGLLAYSAITPLA